MQKLIHLFCAFTLIVFMSSCSHQLRPFTSNVLQGGRQSDSEHGKIQFYLSDEIVIRRNLTLNDKVLMFFQHRNGKTGQVRFVTITASFLQMSQVLWLRFWLICVKSEKQKLIQKQNMEDELNRLNKSCFKSFPCFFCLCFKLIVLL